MTRHIPHPALDRPQDRPLARDELVMQLWQRYDEPGVREQIEHLTRPRRTPHVVVAAWCVYAAFAATVVVGLTALIRAVGN